MVGVFLCVRHFDRRRWGRDQRGAAAVEFALVLVPLLVIVFGLIQYGLYFYASQSGSAADREAVRRVAVGDCQSDTDLTTFVKNRLGGVDVSSLVVSRAYTDPSGASITWPANPPQIGGEVVVTVTFSSLNMHFPFVPFLSNGTVTKKADARVEDTTSSGVCS
jgi:Flp pilus assembly protein TadG